MQTLRQDISYALRQMRLSPVFTLTAMLTLALGIGATTAIFSLIHTIMLKSLPVVDPSRLYRIGDGNDCCVEGSAQDNWGMFSYPFYELMKKNTPEFEELAAFEAGSRTLSTRRSESDRIAKPLRAEFISGNYFSTFGLGAFAGRTIAVADDQASAAPVAMLSYRTWQQQYGSDPKIVGSSFILDGHPFTIIGITPPGFYGETLRSDPPELWIPILQEPVFTGANSFLHHFQAWLRVIGRLKPGATPDAVPARMTTLIRQWLVNDSGMPADWMTGIKAGLPKQIVKVVPAGTGVGLMKEDYGANLRILLGVCCLRLADRLRQYRQPAARSRNSPALDRPPSGSHSALRAKGSSASPSPRASFFRSSAALPAWSSPIWESRCWSPSPFTARSTFPSTLPPRCPSSPSPSLFLCSPACSSAPLPHGSPHTPIRPKRCAEPTAARTTALRCRKKFSSSSRPRSPSSCSQVLAS